MERRCRIVSTCLQYKSQVTDWGRSLPPSKLAKERLDTMHILPISLPPTLTPSSASRSSAGRYLSPAHAYEFANNVLFAEWSGTWLNTSITLAWTKCRGFDPNDPGAAHTYLEAAIDCVRDLLRRRGVAMV